MRSPVTKESDLKTSKDESLKLEKDKNSQSDKNVKTSCEEIDLTVNDTDVKGKDREKVDSDAKAIAIDIGGVAVV